MNIRHSKGFTLIELMTVLAVTAILIASTVPLGAYWIEQANIAKGTGELTQSFGKAIGASLRNQHALDAGAAVAAICISETNQVTVLESNTTTTLNCANGTGDSTWTTTLPENLSITSGINDVSCMCFNASSFLTNTATNCSSCATGSSVTLTTRGRSEVLDVF